jgi:raffinose/stachyose/melibiose transport system substrate-binding protein
MHVTRRSLRTLAGTAAALGLVAVATASTATAGTTRAAANPFAHYGNITLTMTSADNQDPGPEPVIKELVKQFEAKYPNVKVNLTFKGFTDYMKVIQLSLNGNNAPDVSEGNQSYATDALLVKAKLIIPLDKYSKQYHWDKLFSPGEMQQFKWSPDGKQFGTGNLWGVAQFGQSTGLFYNKAKLKQYGVNPNNLPKTFTAFQAMLVKLRKADTSSSDPILVIGNKDGYEALHAWGMLQGAYTPAQDVRNWIFHKGTQNFASATNIKSMNVLMQWVKAGYFGNDYNAIGENDAAAAFAKGKGVFYMGGNWQAAVIAAGLKGNAGFMNMPPGASGKEAAIGATSLPWHIATKSKYPDVDAALINWLINAPTLPKLAYAQNQIPAIVNAPAAKGSPLLSQVAKGWQQLVKANGLTYFPDWSSDTMLTTMGTNFQKMMAGRQSVADTAKAIQADWTTFDKTIKS